MDNTSRLAKLRDEHEKAVEAVVSAMAARIKRVESPEYARLSFMPQTSDQREQLDKVYDAFEGYERAAVELIGEIGRRENHAAAAPAPHVDIRPKRLADM